MLSAAYEVLCLFIIYAFLGWCTEVAFQAVCRGEFINRGFLNGPVCPIYGFGVLLVVWLLTPFVENALLLFLGSTLLTSALEFLTGFVLEKLFHDKWWDYSGEPFNLKGYVCLRFSLAWGLACVFVMKVVHPVIVHLVHWLPMMLGMIVLTAAYALLVADAIVTILATVKLKKRLELMEDISKKLHDASDAIGKPIAENAMEAKERLEERKTEADQLRGKLAALAKDKNRVQKRLLNSFPRLQQGRYQEHVEHMKQHWADQVSAAKESAKNLAAKANSLDTLSSLKENAPLLLYRNTFAIIVDLLDARDPYTAQHSKRVAALARRFCGVLMLPPLQTELIEMTAEVHDIGKIGVRDATLTKAEKLNAEEWTEIKQHPVIGADILDRADKLDKVALGVLHHHERWDGGGYPSGLSGEDIPMVSRIIAICDSTDAMLSQRLYRPALTQDACREELLMNKGCMYDPHLVELFVAHWDDIVKPIYQKIAESALA